MDLNLMTMLLGLVPLVLLHFHLEKGRRVEVPSDVRAEIISNHHYHHRRRLTFRLQVLECSLTTLGQMNGTDHHLFTNLFLPVRMLLWPSRTHL